MDLCFLGTSGSWPTRERGLSALALRPPGRSILLFDCGEGTQRQFMRTTLSFMQVRHVFLTHYHADHIMGLVGMMQTMGLYDRREPMDVWGPEGIEAVIGRMCRIPYLAPRFPVTLHEIRGRASFEIAGGTVTAVPASHSVPALAYAFAESERPGRFDRAKAESLGIPPGPLYARLQNGHEIEHGGRTVRPEEVLGPPRRGRKVVYTGDTAPHPAIVELARGADVLVHEATAGDDHAEMAAAYSHSTARQAAEVARAAGVGLLILTHLSPRYEDPLPLLVQAREVFPRSLLAEDLMHLRVPYPEKGAPILLGPEGEAIPLFGPSGDLGSDGAEEGEDLPGDAGDG